jgi:hypothetical protein
MIPYLTKKDLHQPINRVFHLGIQRADQKNQNQAQSALTLKPVV